MICLRCKNEKWDKEVCPNCGLGENESLLIKADQFRVQEKYSTAIEIYEKYLDRDSENIEVLKKRAQCLYFEATIHRDRLHFVKADEAFSLLLQKDWDWNIGHQLRVDLYFYFGKLDDLSKVYEQTVSDGGTKKNKASEIVKVIELTKKYKETPPAVGTVISSNSEASILFKSFWPLLLGIPLILWLIHLFASEPHSKDDSNAPGLFFILMISALAMIVMIYICMKIYKRNRKNEEAGNGIGSIN